MGAPFREVAAGDAFTCALNAGGEAFCWGRNTFGMLGAGDTEGATTPRQVLNDAAFASIQASGFHACALSHGGIAYCWGLNGAGEAGATTGDLCFFTATVQVDCSLTPAAVSGDLRFRTIDVGWNHNCGLTAQGDAYCWGWNEFSQLGTTTTETCLRNGAQVVPCSRTPLPVDGGLKFRAISAGFWQTCALSVDNQTYCWGRNIFGPFGNGTSGNVSPIPIPGASGVTLAALSSGGAALGCGITTDRTTVCWGGRNLVGELGDGTLTPHLTPAPVAGEPVEFRTVYTMTENLVLPHVCAITNADEARCWGSNRRGQLGTLTTETCRFGLNEFGCSTVPIVVSGGHEFDTLVAGNEHTCGVTKSRAVLCWGRNESGQVGDGSTTDRTEPVQVLPFVSTSVTINADAALVGTAGYE